ncbi:MAG: Gfo/Idh/MocA family oxidoreductase, partial [Armatimonadetes bacterium]|nr:Gfo/Idh/MocA family oxidoreductase [Armatimonadota bacterium]
FAHRFAEGMRAVPDATLDAVASRTPGRADAFADKWNVAKRYGSYEELVADPDIDAVYVSTPHPYHAPCSLLAIEAGKPVLCEKPFTVNAAQARKVVGAARARGVFVMEAMWTRFFPIMARMRDIVAERAVGDVLMVHADFGFRAGVNPEGRLFSPALAGGGLLDVGVYPISLASMLLGKPDRVSGLATVGETGVDESAAIALGYPSGALASLTTGVRVNTPHTAFICTTEGSISIPSPWWVPERMTVRHGQAMEDYYEPKAASGFEYEIREASRCIREGLKESPILPLDETVAIVETMDQLRALWGVRYPMEDAQ